MVKFLVLPEAFGYIDCVKISPYEVEKAIETVKNCPAIILDVRGFPRGTIYQIAPRLISSKTIVAKTQLPYFSADSIYSEFEPNFLEGKKMIFFFCSEFSLNLNEI